MTREELGALIKNSFRIAGLFIPFYAQLRLSRRNEMLEQDTTILQLRIEGAMQIAMA
jgi:hypothetical protein